LKIVHVGSYNYLKDGQSYYSPDYKFHDGFVQNGHFVYPFSHRDTARCENIFKSKRWGVGKTNARLIETCKNIRPELLLLGTAESISAKTLATIKEMLPDIKIAMWFVDPLWLEQHISNIEDKLPFLDAFFATTSGEQLRAFKTKTNKVSYIPNICNAAVETHRNFEKDNLPIGFLFCGRDYKEPGRQAFLVELSKNVHKYDSKFYGCLGNKPIFGAEYVDTLGLASMSMSYNRRNDVELYMSDRIAHLTGNGILTFSPKVPKMEMLYTPDEVVYFDELGDLVAKIEEFKNDDEKRKKIARNGWQMTQNSYNAARVAKYMSEVIFDRPLSQTYEWQSELY